MAHITLRDYLQETEDAISSGRTDEALQRCHRVLNRFPDSLEAQRLLGEVYLALDRLDEAQNAFDWVLTNDPESVIAYCDRALVCERRTDYDTALDCYQQAYELSRGNSQIRNEFNKLSVKAKLPGFMFSRAGLARLYMRGDLMTQAILEWDTVLATNVNRLDARTGMIEAYWRDGQYDRVEQMAQELLQDVPACIKALLLLAHVLSTKNIQRARDLVRQAEGLDPDLLMAQELFSDLFASRQAEPFLQLLKKPPVTLDTTATFQAAQQSSLSSVSDNAVPLSPPAQPAANADIPVWTNHSIPGFEAPATPMLVEQTESEHADQLAFSLALPEAEALQEIPQIAVTPHFEESKEKEISSSDLVGVGLQENLETENPFWTDSQEAMPAPPDWLNALTQGERQQLSGSLSPVMPSEQPISAAPNVASQVSKPPEAESASSLVPLMADEEESFFGPEWLKALGAETIGGGEVDLPASVQPAGPIFEAPQKPKEAPLVREESSSYYGSLDSLERSLRSQGFVDMQPNSLAEIARANNIVQESVPRAQELASLDDADAGLPDALAQLTDFSSDYQARPNEQQKQQETYPVQEDNIVSPAPSTRPMEIDDATVVAPGGPVEMPDWVTLLEQTVTSPPRTARRFAAQQEEPVARQERSYASSAEAVFMPAPETGATPVHEQSSRVAAGPVFEPSRVPPTPPPMAARSNPLLENELETTMRRPAVRLQQIQQARVAGQREHPGRLRSNERALTGKGSDGPMSHRERLLQGYQHQLSGDYDEAMNEYRLIIKAAPDLLSEVVSNLRALLKLAPKYVAGYRVLGDAYMKQGEYLQAMEAYNKALTMAKRAK